MPFTIEKTRDPLYNEGLSMGIQKGVERGLEQGKLEAKRAIAKSMFLNNISIDLIAKVTNLSKEEIEKLKGEI